MLLQVESSLAQRVMLDKAAPSGSETSLGQPWSPTAPYYLTDVAKKVPLGEIRKRVVTELSDSEQQCQHIHTLRVSILLDYYLLLDGGTERKPYQPNGRVERNIK